MILLLGATGYIGQAFAAELRRRDCPFRAVSRAEVNYTRFEPLLGLLRDMRPEFVINCAGFTGKPNVDACENAKADTLLGNALLPQTIAHACAAAELPWGHVSSGCIYTGAKVCDNEGVCHIEGDLTEPGVHRLILADRTRVTGFTETDPPNFSFRAPPCSFYSGAKALGEEAITGVGRSFIWRLRIPFDEFDNGRNYLSKVQRYAKVYDNVNSISHRGDYARACLDCWAQRVPWGTYNVTNPGWVTTREVVALIEKHLTPGRRFEFWENDTEFYQVAAKTPRSNCVLDVTKLLQAGVKIRPVEEALEESLRNWRPEVAVENNQELQRERRLREFTGAMLDIYRRALTEARYRAAIFFNMINDQGGYEAAMTLIHAAKPSDGYTALWERHRLDLTVEALILRPEWGDIFTDEDRLAAYKRLESYHFSFPSDSWHPK
jgi:dTDP-4-dehydrorhamnose reductase